MDYLKVKNVDIADLPKEESDTFYKLLKSYYFTFTHTNWVNLKEDFNNPGIRVYEKYTFYPELEVLIISNYMFDECVYDGWIECNPVLFKAKSVEEAWDYVKESIAEWYISYICY